MKRQDSSNLESLTFWEGERLPGTPVRNTYGERGLTECLRK